MKRGVLYFSLVAVTALNAAEPMVPSSMSTDRGGAKAAIDAYSDGAGVNLYNYENKPVVDNAPMNELVFKYGEDAKSNAVTIQNEVKTISSSSTATDKTLADMIPNITNPIAQSGVKTGSCDDGDPKTLDDKYVNNVCVGTNVEGKSCDDHSDQTINDKYTNGICAGSNVEGQTCDDGNVNTFGDVYHNGICAGVLSTIGIQDIFNDGSGIGLLKFDNSLSYGSGTGTFVASGTKTYIAGKFGNAISLTSSGINLTGSGTFMSPSSNYSVSTWIYRTSARRDVIASRLNAYMPYGDAIMLEADNKITVYFAYSTSALGVYPTSAISIQDGKWHHIVVTVNRNTQVAKAYLDGTYIPWSGPWNQYGGTPYVPKNSAAGNGIVSIGNATSQYANGVFDQTRFFNKELTQAEVTTLYNEQ